jgi:hypothetical protein
VTRDAFHPARASNSRPVKDPGGIRLRLTLAILSGQCICQPFFEYGSALFDGSFEDVVASDQRSALIGRQPVDIAVFEVAVGECEGTRHLVDEDRGLHELAAIVPLKASPRPKIQERPLKTLFVDDTLFIFFEPVHPQLLPAMRAARQYGSSSIDAAI